MRAEKMISVEMRGQVSVLSHVALRGIILDTLTMRQTSNRSGVTPMRTWIFRKRSKSSGVMRSLYVTLEKKFMRMSCESRLPRLPGFFSEASAGIPHLTTTTVGTR